MWKWAKRAKHVRINIFRDLDVDAARKPRRRNRVLTPDEIRTLWAETAQPETFGFTADAAIALRLILATNARPGMVTGMMREELIDLDVPQPRPVLWGQLRSPRIVLAIVETIRFRFWDPLCSVSCSALKPR